MGRGSSKVGKGGGVPVLAKANTIIKVGEGTYGQQIKEGYLTISKNRSTGDYEASLMPNGELEDTLIKKGNIHEVDYELRKRFHIGVDRI